MQKTQNMLSPSSRFQKTQLSKGDQLRALRGEHGAAAGEDCGAQRRWKDRSQLPERRRGRGTECDHVKAPAREHRYYPRARCFLERSEALATICTVDADGYYSCLYENVPATYVTSRFRRNNWCWLEVERAVSQITTAWRKMVTLDVHTEQREAWLGGDLGGDVLERVRRLEADARATSGKLDAPGAPQGAGTSGRAAQACALRRRGWGGRGVRTGGCSNSGLQGDRGQRRCLLRAACGGRGRRRAAGGDHLGLLLLLAGALPHCDRDDGDRGAAGDDDGRDDDADQSGDAEARLALLLLVVLDGGRRRGRRERRHGRGRGARRHDLAVELRRRDRGEAWATDVSPPVWAASRVAALAASSSASSTSVVSSSALASADSTSSIAATSTVSTSYSMTTVCPATWSRRRREDRRDAQDRHDRRRRARRAARGDGRPRCGARPRHRAHAGDLGDGVDDDVLVRVGVGLVQALEGDLAHDEGRRRRRQRRSSRSVGGEGGRQSRSQFKLSSDSARASTWHST